MKKISLEQALLGVTKRQQRNDAFIAATMQAVKQTEAAGTFERQLRTRSTTKQESFIMKLTHMPRFALAGVVATGVVLLSGTAYAAYQLWTQPSAQVTGNAIELRDCREPGERSSLSVDPQSGKSPAEVAGILQAYCEISNIQEWAMQTLDIEASNVLFPYTITNIKGAELTLRENGGSRTVSVNKDTRYVVGGVEVAAGKLKQGDLIAYVLDDARAVKAVIVLEAEAASYAPAMQRLVIVLSACGGNEDELCARGGGISELRVSNGGERSVQQDNWNVKDIQGKLVGFTSDSITLKASSGVHYTVQISGKLISSFNTDASRNAGLQIKLGDTLGVQYSQPAGADKHTIAADQFEQMSLVVTGDAKAGSLQKY